MKKKALWFYYLLVWVIYLAYLWTDNLVENRGSHPYVWSHYTASFAAFTFCFFFLYPVLFKRKRIPLFIVGLLMAPCIFMGMRYVLEEVLYVPIIGHGNYYEGTTAAYYIADNWWRAVQPMLLSFIIWALMDTLKREREREQLIQEKAKAELAFLKLQINPHFLYNTLNYLYSLAYPVSNQLADAIIKLSGLMRHMITEDADHLVPLKQEIDYLENYIELYRMRFEEHFFVDFEVKGDLDHAKIASLVLIAFVENAFKHGITDDASRPIKICLTVSAGKIIFSVTNSINNNYKDESGGIGLSNVKRRLELIYSTRHELLVQNGEIYESTLIIHTQRNRK